MRMEVVYFSGQIEKFIDALQPETKSKIFRTFELLEAYGREVGMPQVKQIDADLFGIRVQGKQRARLLFVFRNTRVVVLHGFVKKTMRIPPNEIETAAGRLHLIDRV